MLCSQSISRLIASLAALATIGSTCPAFAEPASSEATYYPTRPTIAQQLQEGKLLLANHEAAGASVGAVDLLGTEPGGPGTEVLTDSLWGNLILQMAYARDKQLGRCANKLRRTDNLTLAAIYGISGVSLAQSITGLAMLNQGHGGGEVHDEGGEGGEGHDVHDHHDSYAPGILGLISSGSTLGALGLRFYFGHRYSKQIKQRQQEIKGKVVAILARLDKGDSPDDVHHDLEPLIGPRATREFSQLWRATHQIASAASSG